MILNYFNVLILKINFKKNIILIHFRYKNILKNNRYYNIKHYLNVFFLLTWVSGSACAHLDQSHGP